MVRRLLCGLSICLLLVSPTALFATSDGGSAPSGASRTIQDDQGESADVSTFEELMTSQKITVFNLKPNWGQSAIRDVTSTGASGTITDTNGIIQLSSGTNSSGTATLETRERVEYQAGASVEAGIGVKADTPGELSGNQFAEWGPFDKRNGFGWGVDATSYYVFSERRNSKTKVRQSNWNVDTLNGSGDSSNPSGIDLSVKDGAIFQVIFTWYGYGDAQYFILVSDGNERRRVLVHREHFTGQTSVIDPNQPISVRLNNNGSTNDMTVDVGGRQFSIISGKRASAQRPVNEFVSDWTLDGTEDVWEPIMAVRKKDVFPAGANRANSVRVEFVTLKAEVTGEDVQVKVTLSDTTTATFSNVSTWGSESAVESSTNSDGFTAEQGEAFVREFIAAGQGASSGGENTVRERIVIGKGQAMVVWARKEGTSSADLSVVLKWDEQW